MANDPRTELIVDTLLKVVSRRTSNEQRIQNGLHLRTQFRTALAQGIVPVHPRFEWVRKNARTLLELLITMAEDYNKANADGADRASVMDLMDIVEMAHGHVLGIAHAGEMDPTQVELVPFEEVKPTVEVSNEEPSLENLVKGSDDEGQGD